MQNVSTIQLTITFTELHQRCGNRSCCFCSDMFTEGSQSNLLWILTTSDKRREKLKECVINWCLPDWVVLKTNEDMSVSVRCSVTDRRDHLLCLRQVNLTVQINPTRQSGDEHDCANRHILQNHKHTCVHTRACIHTLTHTALQQSAKTSVPLCVCWQRQTVMLLPAAQPLEGKRQTLLPIYSNTTRHQRALPPPWHPCCPLQELWVCLRVSVRLSMTPPQNRYMCITTVRLSSCEYDHSSLLSVSKQDRSPEDIHPPHR